MYWYVSAEAVRACCFYLYTFVEKHAIPQVVTEHAGILQASR